MWPRSSSTYLRTQRLRLGANHTCGNLESPGMYVQRKFADAEPPKFVPGTWLRSDKLYRTAPIFSSGCRYVSSQVGAINGGHEDDELEEGFSELDVSQDPETNENPQMEGLVYEEELSHEGGVENTPESEMELDIEPVGARSSARSILARLILDNPKSVKTVLDKYVSDGSTVDVTEASCTMIALRKRQMYWQALQFSEWLEAKNTVEFVEYNYASRIDLIAKVHGLHNARDYIESVPKSFRGELVYRTLLANCVSLNNVKNAEEVYNKMKQLSFATSAFTCNQMIILYKKIDKKKIADVLLHMQKENVKPTLVTYRLLIDTKGRSLDMDGMEKVLGTMKGDGFKPDVSIKAIMAKHYIAAGFKEKANSVLMEIEGSNVRNIRAVCSTLIPLYASLGKEVEVERVWKICEPNARHDDYLAAISAWGKLKKIEKAEAAFKKLEKTKKLESRHYATMLRVYADNKMVNKGKDLMRRMGENGCQIGPLTWDALVKLYVETGEVEKADTVLKKASMQQNDKIRAMFSSYMTIMEEYAKRGDVHNSEKTFYRLKQAGYGARLTPFRTLLQAYMQSKTPPYGFRERMMAENVFPNRTMISQLSQADPFNP